MININMVEAKSADPPKNGEKKRYTVMFGRSNIIDVMAASEREAEEKFMFFLIYELRGKTLDFDPADIPDKKSSNSNNSVNTPSKGTEK